MSNISHERSVPTSERSSTAEIGQVHTRGIPLSQSSVAQASNASNSTASATYSSPSPPPPAPAPLSSLHAQTLHSYETSNENSMRGPRASDAANATYVNYSVPRSTAPMGAVPWPAASNASMDPSILYSLERNQVPRPDELAALLPIVSEINQEVRTLTSPQDGRAGRDYVDVVPYYPWLPGSSTSTTPTYWSPNTRDEREVKPMRIDESKSATLPRGSPSVRTKPDRAMQRGMRTSTAPEEHGLAGRYGNEHGPLAAPGGSRSEPYAPYPVRPAKGELNDMNSSQQTYVPKYKKRSRAPAPGVCHSCGNSDTPEWRRGPDGARTLCNACGLHFAKLVRRRTLEYASAAPGVPIPPVTIAELRQSTNVNTNSPSVAQADDERARLSTEATASSLRTTADVATGPRMPENTSSETSHVPSYHENQPHIASHTEHQDVPMP